MIGFVNDNKRIVLFSLLIFLCIGIVGKVYADEGEIVVEYEKKESKKSSEEAGFLPIDKIFKNPIFASGIDSGIASINRSIETVMESIFYSLLDNQLVYNINDWASCKAVLDRKLHTTSYGSYVVVDRFGIGPNYLKPLTYINDIPVDLGVDGKVNIFNIYIRSDSFRLAQDEELPLYRRIINNWFGLLPLLTFILPPSFNPNELYDPIKQLKTPFILPMSLKGFRTMEIGSIRSYSISGGVRIGFDALSKRGPQIRKLIEIANEVDLAGPYSIFRTGEHRINVLRKSEHIAWVGLSNTEKTGHGIDATLGKTYMVFSQVFSKWKGIQAYLYPIDLGGSIAKLNRYNQLYSFDLRKETALNAYKSAVKGDFAVAYREWLKERNHGIKSGVSFLYSKTKSGIESALKRNKNFIVYNTGNEFISSSMEVKTVKGNNIYYSLEGTMQSDDANWDILVGDEKMMFNNKVEIAVLKGKKGASKYIIDYSRKDPINLILALHINDQFTTTRDFNNYLEVLRSFAQLPLDEIPKLSLFEQEKINERVQKFSLIEPLDSVKNIHVTPTYLGKTDIDAAIYFDSERLNDIFSKGDDQIWRAFAAIYGIGEESWNTVQKRASFYNKLRWLLVGVSYPLRLFNIYFPFFDAILDCQNKITAMRKIKGKSDPLAKLEAFQELIDTNYPIKFAQVLLKLTKIDQVPRSIGFTTRLKGKNNSESRSIFEGLNRRIIRSKAKKPQRSSHGISAEKLSAFNPSMLPRRDVGVFIKKVRIYTKKEYMDNDKKRIRSNMAISLEISGLFPVKEPRLFIRIEQGGKINLGRFVIGQKIINLNSWASFDRGDKQGRKQRFEFFLTGPTSPLAGFLYDRFIDMSGIFSIMLSVSQDNLDWSKMMTISFRLEEGKLRKVD